MARFCGHCGSRLDEVTGLCPNCNAAQMGGSAAVPSSAGRNGGSVRENSDGTTAAGRHGIGIAVGLIMLVGIAAAMGGAFLFMTHRDRVDDPVRTGVTARDDSAPDDIADTQARESAAMPTEETTEYVIPAENTTVEAMIADDGTAYIPQMDGSCIEIAGDVAYAAITPDREHIVVLLHDGTLYVTDMEQTNQSILSNEAVVYLEQTDLIIRNDGLLYRDDSQFYRARFADGSVQPVGISPDIGVAPHTISMVYKERTQGADTADIYH